MAVRKSISTAKAKTASYQHPDAKAIIRPEAGTQTRFSKKKPAATYRYDSSLSPELAWDEQNPAREQGETQLASLEAAFAVFQTTLAELQGQLSQAKSSATASELAKLLEDTKSKIAHLQANPLRTGQEAAAQLKALSKPFLNWAGKAERLSFDVPTLPLFIHERLSTQAILDSVATRLKDQQLDFGTSFFGHPERTLPEQLLKAYEHPNGWQNRMILGDSLVVMNSLLHYENMGGSVQMIYIDPPYGVKFGSNFQPFVRKRDVSHNDDEGFTREPEMVKAYRDTWELGLHSYLTYLRDRLLMARELLTESGSVFVQISDENLHHLREILDEVFGADNSCSIISLKKTSGLGATLLPTTQDFLLWYAKDRKQLKFRRLFTDKTEGAEDDSHYSLDADGRRFTLSDLTGQNNDVGSCIFEYEFQGKKFNLPRGRQWKTTRPGIDKLVEMDRVVVSGKSIRFKRYVEDFPVSEISDTWHDIGGSVQSRIDPKIYVVQTGTAAIQRAILMTTDPGDLVLDPTCGSGTTAYVAESWGRRWITIDTSRVPLALARQRLLTGIYPYWDLREQGRGPAGGFIYKEKRNRNGGQIGGIVPHTTLGSIANNEPPKYEVLVDRPEEISGVTRVCGPFVFEATIPTASNFDGESSAPNLQTDSANAFIDRMVEVLRSSPVLHLPGGKSVEMAGIRRPAKTLFLSAEAQVRESVATDSVLEAAESGPGAPSGEPVALLFGPEHGPISELAVLHAWQEATAKNFKHLYVIGFAIEPKARQSIGEYSAMGMPTTYVQATPDILMGDLLKNMRSSQIFSVCGQPDVLVRQIPTPKDGIPNEAYYEVQLQGLDVFDPITSEIDKRSGLDVPAWFLDTDYNGLVFRVCQAFFPRTQSWDNLKRALKADFDESVWAHLAGDTSTPFSVGTHKQIAVKVIDDRGNELMVVKSLESNR